MEDMLWEVVGGVERGGIVVRQGEDTQSAMEQERLSTGARLRVLEYMGGRLHFERVWGTGPVTGWVSEKLKDGKDLVVRTDVPAPPPKPDRKGTKNATGELYVSLKTSQYPGPKPPPIDRPKMRVLVLHGAGSNATAIKFQSVRLKTLTRAYAEWDFLEGPKEWDDEELRHHTPRDVNEERIKGMGSYRGWWVTDYDPPRPCGWTHRECHFDFSYKVTFSHFEEAMDHVKKHMAEKGPYDVILCFSVAAVVVSTLAATIIRDEGRVPWRLLLLFNGMFARDEKWDALVRDAPLDIPCVQVYGRNDHFRQFQSDRLMRYYTNPIILEHDGHHSFPSPDLPHTEELYAEVAASMRWHCGFEDV
mmetsp:Transcript_107990/g.322930  ORF Transcript_107990/g.322930 Transcript_107990/m.322930 type:complete len:361 (+) Transcript_107990:1-1083(+)